ncbi:MAG: ABC transporter substrate-binding protein [Bacteroidales bacterium]|nr:ABC transporter substrate-binding protein [Bacteroidales bacterium]
MIKHSWNKMEMKRWLCFTGIVVLFFLPPLCFSQTSQDQLKDVRSTITETVDGKTFYIHTIRRGQTLYMISKAYGVQVNDIIRENPEVKEGIKADQKIRIPKPEDLTKPKEKPVTVNKALDSASMEKKEVPKEKVLVPTPVIPENKLVNKDNRKKSVYNVALMLPLYLNSVDELQTENPEADINETAKSLQFLPFYEGFRLALDSLDRSGIKIILWVYDVGKDTIKTRQTLDNPEMKQMDLIIGLLYHKNFVMAADFAKKNNIAIVNPITERSDLLTDNPMVFKIKPAKKRLAGQVSEYLAGTVADGKILIVRNAKYDDPGAADQLNKICLEKNLDVQVVEGQDKLMAKMSKEKENWVVVFCSNSAYALDITRRLFQARNDYSVSLIGLPFWADLEGLETEYLVGLKAHVVSDHFIDYDDLAVKRFVARYQSVFFSDPLPLAFEGYDVAMYFLTALKECGPDLPSRDQDLPKLHLLHTTFDFLRIPGNGSESQHWEIYKYGNYKLVKAN